MKMSFIKVLFVSLLFMLVINQTLGAYPDRFGLVINSSVNKYDSDKNYLVFSTCRIYSNPDSFDEWDAFLDETCDTSKNCLYGVLYNQNSNADNNYILNEIFKDSSTEFENKAYKALALGSSRTNPKFKYYVAWNMSISERSILSYNLKYFNSREKAIVYYNTHASGIKFLYDSTLNSSNRFDSLNVSYDDTNINLKKAFYSFASGADNIPPYSTVDLK
jgi:hypothetical protein